MATNQEIEEGIMAYDIFGDIIVKLLIIITSYAFRYMLN